jgi:hypothetical protein
VCDARTLQTWWLPAHRMQIDATVHMLHALARESMSQSAQLAKTKVNQPQYVTTVDENVRRGCAGPWRTGG